MRPGRNSLVAMMAILLVSGCSASRSTLRPDDEGPDRPSVPPQHEGDYSPDRARAEEEFRRTIPPVPSAEPVLAPPATGVSRVKSVSWFGSHRSEAHSIPAPCGSECGDDAESLVGRCSPVESCVPANTDSSSQCVERYRETVCDDRCAGRRRPARNIRESISKWFHQSEPVSCTDECAGHVTPSSSCVPEYDDECAAPRPRNFRSEIPSRKRPGRLADPLDDTSTDDSDPGMITPGEPGSPENPEEAPRLPAPEPVPGVPMVPAQELHNPPVPEEPPVPTPVNPSTQIVEPPSWPRLKNPHSTHQVSQPVSVILPTQRHAGTTIQLPLIVPKASR